MGDVQIAALLTLTALAVYTDLTENIIPNRLVAAGLLLSLIFRITGCGTGSCHERLHGLLAWAAGFTLPLLLLWVLFSFRMIGAGDLKLFCMIGAFTGPKHIMRIIPASFFSGALCAAILMIYRGNIHSRFLYLRAYVIEYVKTGKRLSYRKGSSEDGFFCFSVPVLAGLLCWTVFLR